ncbi:MAG: pyrroloquinoline quinone biosynthesis protein PqqE, partial [Parafannyhessea umbonata]|nr:pyrroloquinoline quinone biosynthesis protein PqqE [Parafannyhessea umbonata]
FIHYSNVNIRDHSWLECLQQPLFQSYRKHYPWNDNMLQPCPMLENPNLLPKMVKEAGAHSTEYVTPEEPEAVQARTTPYAQTWAPTATKLWLEEHPTGKKVFADKMSMVPQDEKGKILAAEDEEREAVLD